MSLFTTPYAAFDSVSIPAGNTVTSTPLDATYTRRARVLIHASGANVTVSAEVSADSGTTWFPVATYAAGATGAQAVLELVDKQFRLKASNAGAAAESVTAYAVLGTIA